MVLRIATPLSRSTTPSADLVSAPGLLANALLCGWDLRCDTNVIMKRIHLGAYSGGRKMACALGDVASVPGKVNLPCNIGFARSCLQVARLGVPFVLMHMRGDPTTMQLPANTEYPLGTVEGVADELRAAACRAIAAGIEPWRLILDPGESVFDKARDSGACARRRRAGIGCLSLKLQDPVL